MESNWYEICVNELQLPGSPWYSVFELIAESLAYRIRLEGLTYDQLYRVSKFVGDKFMKKYHLHQLLDTGGPNAVKSSRLKTDSEVQQFLKELTIKSASQCGCTIPVNESSEEKFLEMISLIQNTCQTKINSLQTSSDADSVESRRDAFGQTLVKILQTDASRFNYVLARLKGQPMPQCLRQYLYKLLLLKRTKKVLQYTFPEAESYMKKLRVKFASAVKSGMIELRILKTSDSSMSQLISSSVAKAFETNPGLSAYTKDLAMQQQCCRVLNILYIRRRQFNVINILWLAPLLVTFNSQNSSKELDYEIAMWLNVLIDHFVPNTAVVNQIVFSAWQNALKHSTKLLAFKSKDLSLILQSLDVSTDEETVKKYLTSTTLLDRKTQTYDSLHIIFLIRQWVLHLFVGQLDLATTLYIWDQLFLNDWNPNCFARICLVLIYSLADDISQCTSKTQLLDLFRKNSADIQLQVFREHWKNFDSF